MSTLLGFAVLEPGVSVDWSRALGSLSRMEISLPVEEWMLLGGETPVVVHTCTPCTRPVGVLGSFPFIAVNNRFMDSELEGSLAAILQELKVNGHPPTREGGSSARPPGHPDLSAKL